MGREYLVELDVNDNKIVNLADGESDQDAASTKQVNDVQAMLDDLEKLHWMGVE